MKLIPWVLLAIFDGWGLGTLLGIISIVSLGYSYAESSIIILGTIILFVYLTVKSERRRAQSG